MSRPNQGATRHNASARIRRITARRRPITAIQSVCLLTALALGLPSFDAAGEMAAATQAAATERATAGAAIDACSLLTDAEVSSVVGAHRPGFGTSALGFGCNWDTTDGSASLGVHVGNPGSADNGAASLRIVQSRPGSRPGPDGMVIRQVPNTDMVHVVFAADGRTCVVQVIRSSGGDRVRAAVELAHKVQGRIRRRSASLEWADTRNPGRFN